MAYPCADVYAFAIISGGHDVVTMGGERSREARIAFRFVMAAGHIVPAQVAVLEEWTRPTLTPTPTWAGPLLRRRSAPLVRNSPVNAA